jgi:FkbM family methyltransferase
MNTMLNPSLISYQPLRALGRFHYIRFGIRDRIIRLFCNPDNIDARRFSSNFYGLQYNGSLDSFLDWSTYFYGAYEKSYLTLCGDILRKIDNPTVLDIGANVGHHSMFFSTLATTVHAFEPWDESRNIMHQRIAQNEIRNIKVHPYGLADTNESRPFFPPTGPNRGVGSFVVPRAASNILTLDLHRGDEVLPELGISRVDFIKMDIEGYEPFALKGLIKTLREDRPVILFEWSHESEANNPEGIHNLFPSEYRMFEIIADQPMFGVLCRSKYSLRQLGPNRYGNFLAVPAEKSGILENAL